jgi:hypothetical protein
MISFKSWNFPVELYFNTAHISHYQLNNDYYTFWINSVSNIQSHQWKQNSSLQSGFDLKIVNCETSWCKFPIDFPDTQKTPVFKYQYLIITLQWSLINKTVQPPGSTTFLRLFCSLNYKKNSETSSMKNASIHRTVRTTNLAMSVPDVYELGRRYHTNT